MNVLVVDDNQMARYVLIKNLQQLTDKLNFFEAEDVEHALEIIKNNDINAVILDIDLPKLDGFYLMDAIKKSKSINIIITTASITKEGLARAIIGGVKGVMIKPIEAPALLNLITA